MYYRKYWTQFCFWKICIIGVYYTLRFKINSESNECINFSDIELTFYYCWHLMFEFVLGFVWNLFLNKLRLSFHWGKEEIVQRRSVADDESWVANEEKGMKMTRFAWCQFWTAPNLPLVYIFYPIRQILQ